MKRVVITGLGLVSPLSASAKSTFEKLCGGEVGFRILEEQDVPGMEDLPIKLGGVLPDDFDASAWIKKLTVPKNIINAEAFAVSSMAIKDSGFEVTEKNSHRIGAIFGQDRTSSIDIRNIHQKVMNSGYSKLDPFTIMKFIVSQSLGTIGVKHQIKGYCNVVCAGNASGHIAIKDSAAAIRRGQADAMVAVAAETDFDPAILMSYYKAGCLSRNPDPTQACRPFNSLRDGWVYSVGAGAVMLESLDHALERGAPIYAELGPVSNFADTEDHKSGMRRAMSAVSEEAEVVVADAPGWRNWDELEASAIQDLWPNSKVTSLKWSLGHMLVASGMAQVATAALALKTQTIPGIVNLDEPLKNELSILQETQKAEFSSVVSNSFSYEGGCFSSLLLKNVN